MGVVFYRVITRLTATVGLWVFPFFAWFVATGYYLFFPFRVRTSVRFYRELFPDRRFPYHLGCAWRQFHNFTDVFFDRFLLTEGQDLNGTSEGLEHLDAVTRSQAGALLLMSHMGNWEVAAHILKRERRDLRLMLYMGAKNKEQLERIQKQSLSQSGVRIVAVDEEGGSPVDIIEGIKFIASGGVVSMTGDLLWKKEQRSVAVRFLGREARLPEAPFLLAHLSGAPLLIFFAFRTGRRQYHFSMAKPICIQASSRRERAAAIHRAAQQYADIMETMLRRYPLQWYHFRPFFEADR